MAFFTFLSLLLHSLTLFYLFLQREMPEKINTVEKQVFSVAVNKLSTALELSEHKISLQWGVSRCGDLQLTPETLASSTITAPQLVIRADALPQSVQCTLYVSAESFDGKAYG